MHHLAQGQHNKDAEMIVLEIEKYGICWKFEKNNKIDKKIEVAR